MQNNIILYFSDQQRWDTINEIITPNLMQLKNEGVLFENNYTCQPVCGPARSCLQSGMYATQTGCYCNGIALPTDIPPIARYFNEAGYQTAYIGKWHLASDRYPKTGIHCENGPIPKQRQGEYQYWRAADCLEFTSHGYDGYIFDGEGNKIDFKGYRADCINDFALEFLDKHDKEKPFFLTVSQLEPHHQNDHHHFEGYKETINKYKKYPIPEDLAFLNGDYNEMYPDYISAINRVDYNLGKLINKLNQLNIYDNTIIIYTSDHGCHFKTRNLEYKRSCHEASIHTPLIIKGGGFEGGYTEQRLSSLIDLPPTMLSMAGIDIPKQYMGFDLTKQINKPDLKRDCVYIQISESQCGRAIRTEHYKYSVRDISPTGYAHSKSKVYFEDYLYDLKLDPKEKNNLVKSKKYKHIRSKLKDLLIKQISNAGEEKPLILPALYVKKK